MVSRTTVVVVVSCCLLVSMVTSGVVAGAAQSTASSTESISAVESAESDIAACFPDDGFEFTIGTQGPEISMILHMSLLTNLGGAGALGIELTGSIGGPPIIELRTGVLFDGIDTVGEFLNNPFGPFSIAFEYVFELPMFGEGFAYEESDAPIDGPVGDADC